MPKARETPSSRAACRSLPCWILLIACLAWLPHAVAAEEPAPWIGLRVVDIVEQLRAGGLNILYSSAVLPDHLRVEAEPGAVSGPARLAEILAAHGLTLSEVAPATYAIEAAGAAAATRASPEVTRETAPAPLPSLEMIVVAASRYALVAGAPNVHVFMTHSELESLPKLGEETLKAVDRLPGAAGNSVSGLAHVRGGGEDETIILLDGLPLHEPFHLRSALSPVSLLSTHIVDSLDVHFGGFTAPYGDRMSAVIDVNSVRPVEDRYHELGLSVFHASALAAHRFDEGQGQWLLSARRSNLQEISRLAKDSVAEPFYYDVFGRVEQQLSERTGAALRFLLSRDLFEVDDPDSGEASRAEFENAYLWATVDQQWSERARTSLSASWTDVTSKRRGVVIQPGIRSGSVDDRRRYQVLGLKADNSWQTGAWLHSFGVDARRVDANYDYRSEASFAPGYPLPGAAGMASATELQASPSGGHIALYFSSRFRLTSRITAEAGLRWDQQTYNDANDADDQLGPRINLVYAPDERTRLRLSWGRYHQFQDINELEVESGSDAFGPAQHAEHAIVALERDLSPALAVRVEAYHKTYDRLRPRYENLFDPVAWLPELSADRIVIEPESAQAQGIEALLTLRDAGPWSGWLGYAWSRVTDRIDGRDVLRSWDQTHAINAGTRWSSDRWDLSLAGSWHTGWPTTPVTIDTADNVMIGARNSTRLPSFASIDLRASRRFDVSRGELLAFLEVSNALNRQNPCCVAWTVAADESGSSQLSRKYDHWLPLVPSLGVLWKF